MKISPRTQFFLWKTDFFTYFKEEKRGILTYSAFLLFGILLGILVGVKIGYQDTPYGLIALIFRGQFAPLSIFLKETFCFLLLSAICSLCLFLPIYRIYPIISLILFGKRIGEIACLVFLSDPVSAFMLSLLVLFLPIALIGGFLLIRIALQVGKYRLSDGGFPCKNAVQSACRNWLYSITWYAGVLFFLYFLVCGVLFLLIVGI